MNDIERIYSLLLHSNGLKIRAISLELELDKYYVAEIMFSSQNLPYWYQDDDSLWYAKEGALLIEEPEEKIDELVTPAEKPLKFNVEKFLRGEISKSLRIYLNQTPCYRLYTKDELLELVRRYRAGDRTAFELLVKSQQRLVANIAFLYRNRGVSLEDLIQEGNIGLLRSIERFDDSHNSSFSNYAKAWILQAISFSMTSLPYTVHFSSNFITLHRKFWRFIEKYVQQHENPPSIDEIIIDGINNDGINLVYNLPSNLNDLTPRVEDLDVFESNISAIDRIEEVEYNNYKANVLLNSLPYRTKGILELYFGIGCVQESLEQIGMEYNLTRERVRQILVKAIKILRERVKRPYKGSDFISKEAKLKITKEREAFLKEIYRKRTDSKDTKSILHTLNQKPNTITVPSDGNKTGHKSLAKEKNRSIQTQEHNKKVSSNVKDIRAYGKLPVVASNENSTNNINTNVLRHIFSKTVSSYKYYWFISILQLLKQKKRTKILVYDIVIRMLANAWHPIVYHQLNFGKSDSLAIILKGIQRFNLMPNDPTVDIIYSTLKNVETEYQIKRLLKALTWNVPYRFLNPWINTSDNKDLMRRSQQMENDCLYSLYMDRNDPYISINPKWVSYLKCHHEELLAFSYNALYEFVQTKNPDTIDINGKIGLYQGGQEL